MIHTINRNVYGDILAQHQPKAIETEAENEAAIVLAESLEQALHYLVCSIDSMSSE